jgi:CubicO group peptidase (beta-lactamase class C family)
VGITRREFLGSVGFALLQDNIDEAVRLINAQTANGEVAAATLYVRRSAKVFQHAFGKAADPNAVFLLASISKPMTATGVMILADRKQLSLTDPVQRYIPEFRGQGREEVLIRHLLTHTSGLPDMLPENDELRRRHAPLSEFVAGTCRTPLLFRPGAQYRYQSMGILLAAEIASRISKQPFPVFLNDQVFQPLGLRQTSLGLGGRALASTMQCQVDQVTDWDWNSIYWRNLASPWGGGHSTASDIGKFLQSFTQADGGVVKLSTAAAMITCQTDGLKRRWGLGWGLDGLGKGCSPATFGHSGSTGTLCWHDPRNSLTFVLLTTRPSEHSNKSLLSPVSNLISLSE